MTWLPSSWKQERACKDRKGRTKEHILNLHVSFPYGLFTSKFPFSYNITLVHILTELGFNFKRILSSGEDAYRRQSRDIYSGFLPV